MSHHGPFQPDPFWDSVKINSEQVMDIVSVHFVFFFFLAHQELPKPDKDICLRTLISFVISDTDL